MFDNLICLLKDKFIWFCLGLLGAVAYLFFKDSIIELCEQFEMYVGGIFVVYIIIKTCI